MDHSESIRAITDFLHRIDIVVVEKALPRDTFLPGIQIEHGALAIDRAQLLYPGDMLHEAGHIACMAPSKRSLIFGNVGDDMGEEIASHAWSYAAALAAEVPPELVFHKDGYQGSAEWMCDLYKGGGTPGVALLGWFDMTDEPDQGDACPKTAFPKMRRWLRPMDDPTDYWKSLGY